MTPDEYKQWLKDGEDPIHISIKSPDMTIDLEIEAFTDFLIVDRAVEKLKGCFPSPLDVLEDIGSLPGVQESYSVSADENAEQGINPGGE